MSDFELFSGFDGNEQMDEKAFERYKEQMRANAAQIKLLQQAEQRQKKKEDELIKILIHFLKTAQKTDILLLVVRCLEENIPADFLLSIILLISTDIQEQIGVHLQIEKKQHEHPAENHNLNQIIHFDPEKEVLPLKIKIALDLWGKNMFEVASGSPHKIITQTLDNHHKIKSVVIKLTAAVLRNFLENNQVEGDFKKITHFSTFMLTKIIDQLKKQTINQKELKQ